MAKEKPTDKTADDLGTKYRNQPIQVGLDGDSIILKILD